MRPTLQHAICAALLCATPLARAEAPPDPSPLAVVISGGGTKGAYMAGHLYYMGLVRRASAAPLQPVVFTGASAGAINSLLTALTTCGAAEPNPTESVYWRSWVPVGIDDMFVPDKVTATGLLTTDGFNPAIDALRDLWNAGLPTSCDLLVGVTVTRATPQRFVPAPGLPAIPRSRETAILRITGQGPGLPPRVTNDVDAARVTPQILLPLDGPEAQPFDAIVQLVLASAAFPIGFQPVHVDHCLSVPGQPPTCAPGDAHRDAFVDGGVFDNQPLGLAVQALRRVRVEDGQIRLGEAGAFPGTSRIYLLDPAAVAWPVNTQDDHRAPAGLLDVLGEVRGMAESAQSVELMAEFDDHPEIAGRLMVARTWLPHVSDTFSGLLERSFREFDFYLGMYNAARSVAASGDGAGLPTADSVLVPPGDVALNEAWRPFRCLRAVLDGVGHPSVCDVPELANFRVLLQLSIHKLRKECADQKDTPTDNTICAAAMRGEPEPRVRGVPDLGDDAPKQRGSENDLMFQLRELGAHGFVFKDLGLSARQSMRAGEKVSRLAHDMVQTLARRQPRYRLFTGAGARIGVDAFLGYLPPHHILYLTAGLGAELGYSAGFQRHDLRWLRFNVALASEGVTTWFTQADNYATLSPRAGVEFEPYGSAWLQLRVGLRVGYQGSTADGFGGRTCDYTKESTMPCSRLVTDAVLSASVAGLLRLQLSMVYLPQMAEGQRDQFQLRPTAGVQINSPF